MVIANMDVGSSQGFDINLIAHFCLSEQAHHCYTTLTHNTVKHINDFSHAVYVFTGEMIYTK